LKTIEREREREREISAIETVKVTLTISLIYWHMNSIILHEPGNFHHNTLKKLI
jgi:hypothetical protein